MKLRVSVGSKLFSVDIFGDSGILTLGQLRCRIAEEADLDRGQMKIIHRGKSLTDDDSFLLEQLVFKENDKLLVMGKAKIALKDNPGFSSLIAYEKKHLIDLQKQYDDIGTDLSALEQNFLDAKKSHEMIKKMDKRLKIFIESSLRHLEAIDGLPINTEDTSEEQATRNREKRKALVDGIQTLLNKNDKHVGRLEEYRKRLDGEIL